MGNRTATDQELAFEPAVALYERVQTTQAPGAPLHPGGLVLTSKALAHAELAGKATVLDVGCGTGNSVRLMSEIGLIPWGLDLSFNLLLQGSEGRITPRFLQGNAVNLPFQNGSIDGILCECCLSVFRQPQDVLCEFARVLSPHGKLILTDLYVRNPAGQKAVQVLIPESCIAHAFIKESLVEMLENNSFGVLNWEDCSEVLRNQTCFPEFKSSRSEVTGNNDVLDEVLCIARTRPGYFICVAEHNSLKSQKTILSLREK